MHEGWAIIPGRGKARDRTAFRPCSLWGLDHSRFEETKRGSVHSSCAATRRLYYIPEETAHRRAGRFRLEPELVPRRHRCLPARRAGCRPTECPPARAGRRGAGRRNHANTRPYLLAVGAAPHVPTSATTVRRRPSTRLEIRQALKPRRQPRTGSHEAHPSPASILGGPQPPPARPHRLRTTAPSGFTTTTLKRCPPPSMRRGRQGGRLLHRIPHLGVR